MDISLGTWTSSILCKSWTTHFYSDTRLHIIMSLYILCAGLVCTWMLDLPWLAELGRGNRGAQTAPLTWYQFQKTVFVCRTFLPSSYEHCYHSWHRVTAVIKMIDEFESDGFGYFWYTRVRCTVLVDRSSLGTRIETEIAKSPHDQTQSIDTPQAMWWFL